MKIDNRRIVLIDYATGLPSERHFALEVETIDGCDHDMVIIRKIFVTDLTARRAH
jgi:hypothetical protein